MRKAPTLRSVAIVAALIIIFGGGGAILFGAFDEAQTGTRDNLFNPAFLWKHVSHFFTETWRVITTGSVHGAYYHTFLLQGIGTTLEFCFLSMPVALLLGLTLALMSRSKSALVRVPARGFVQFFRDTPLPVQLLAIYWGLGFFGPSLVNAFTAGLATLALNYAAYECENLRGAIEALDRGQSEAAAVLGLSGWQTVRQIIIPQMIPTALPPVINDLIYLFKDSAVLSFIATSFLAVGELTSQTNILTRRAPSVVWQLFLVAAIAYLLLSLPLTRLARMVEARLKTTAFVPRFDLASTALVVLLVMLAVGWLCGVVVAGFSANTLGMAAQQLVFGLVLTLGILVFSLLLFGIVLYLPQLVFGVFRPKRARTPSDTTSAVPLLAK